MVHLILSSTKGNQGIRYFPYSGYLGLTPVRVEGVVRTKLDGDLKCLPTKSITISVRCYESRVGRTGILHSNILVDYTQILWSTPDGTDYDEIGDLEFPFRITIPANVAGFSTTSFVEYRCMWRVEAIVNHLPLSGVGTRQIKGFELPLLRHDIPPYPKSAPSSSPPVLNYETTKPRAPRIRYSINSPTSPIGPLDLVSIPVHLLPVDSAVSFRSASVTIERRIQFNETTANFPQLPTTATAPTSSHASPLASVQLSASPSLISLSSASDQESINTILSSTPLLSPTSTPSLDHKSLAIDVRPPLASTEVLSSKLAVTSIAGAESSGLFARDDSGVWSKTLTIQWPAAKSNSRWAIGETIQSDLVSVRFFVRMKIVVSSPSGTESMDLSEQELLVVSTNEAERQLAIAKYNEFDNAGRSKPMSPRRSRLKRETLPPLPRSTGTYPSPTGAENTHKPSSPSVQLPSGKPAKPKTSYRRPHTSAGPRDRVLNFSEARIEDGFARLREPQKQDVKQEDPELFRRRSRVEARTKPDSGSDGVDFEVKNAGPTERYVVVPCLGHANGNSNGTTTSTSSIESSLETRSDDVREWEEVLARIEVQSRRSSDMLGFACKRKRITG